MKRTSTSLQGIIGISLLSMLFLLYHAEAAGMEAKSDSVTIQKMDFGDDEFDYTPGAIAFSPQGYLLIAGTSHPAERKLDVAEKLWLWKVSLEGEKLQEIELKPPLEGQDFTQGYAVQSMRALENGDVLLLVAFFYRGPSLVRLDKMGQVVFVTELVPLRRTRQDTVLFKIIQIDAQHFFLIGFQSEDALLVKVDDAGNTLWEKTFDHENKLNAFFDGFTTADGGAVLVGSSGTQWPIAGSNPSGAWLVRVDAEGTVRAEQTFPGRNARIARAADGNWAIAYDLGQNFSQDAWLQVLTPELKSVWKTHLFSADFGQIPLQIAAASDGGYVLATTKRNIRLWIGTVDKEGKQTGEYFEEKDAKLLVDNGPIAARGAFFLLSRLAHTNAKKQSAYKVQVIKFTVK